MGIIDDLRTAARRGWTLREVQVNRENEAAQMRDLKRREVEALEAIAKSKS